MSTGTPIFNKYFAVNAKNPQQKNAPIVYGSQDLLYSVDTWFLFLSIIIKAEKPTIKKIAITDVIVKGALNKKIETIEVKTT